MGLFGDKQVCSICGGKLSALTRVKLEDGFLCNNCTKKCGGSILEVKARTSDKIREFMDFVDNNQKEWESFETTFSINNFIKIDNVNKKFAILKSSKEQNPIIFNFADLADYELVEDGETITKGGLGSAAVGGVLLGGAGAIVGSVTGKKKSASTVNRMYIRISFSHKWISQKTIDLINTETKKSGGIYRLTKDIADQIISALDGIVHEVENDNNKVTSSNNSLSSADEILKFKNLLDSGIITQEEFEAKKKQLLGL
ncbi:DUF4428 domain-containing protein [Lactonifactor sp. BIOML-A3]|uniref:DUF4428 domain-containing protein n=1 Tax=unclassified Lactonifactor TaxID=2636670 RepID=UPI0012B0EE58|nr:MULTISPECIES: DUF4428 domain-containing protein [unclassified Lactonifactor]MSA02948.1 DUF4428 domain-containing protein [Lactonifactor sp. BIOML-A5]MSA10256.1 DUF4428 domain-containing protein [Lactonifactor sp. BIOML-A4]MSA13595.1 DUF4428 domain-containing protein [Lactonifactor sp. BIOML-A3]MSA19229.1 DUF4428 domain-containing protein [Lactonifactor sp. BIOML-A2]MSA39149.1 DUF4428 domain-containing protein [Lactonifactor sp. BIOML-A1]